MQTQFFDCPDPLALRSGETLPSFRLAYETYGRLSAEGDNCILLFHALTGSQHAAGFNPAVDGVGELWNEECHEGWWSEFIGPGLALDTDRFFVVCANYLGGCYGSSGPTTLDPETGRLWGRRFPHIAIADTVDSQIRLLDHLGVGRLWAAIGNSTGGLACLSLATRYPDRVRRLVPAASGLGTTPLHRVLNFEQIVAIQSDPQFCEGDYPPGAGPVQGLRLARMISHKAFVSLDDMERRSRMEVSHHLPEQHWYQIGHPLESYMLHQGEKLPPRFDANSYLRILDAWQTFDLLADANAGVGVGVNAGSFEELFARCRDQRFLVFSIDSDVCFYPEEQERLVSQLRNADVETLYITVHSEKGHDSFLLEPELFSPHLEHFLRSEVR